MRILVLCANHSLGDERVVARQALSLARMGHDVTVLGRGDPGKWLPTQEGLTLHALSDILRGSSWRGKVRRVKVLVQLYRNAVTRGGDIVVAHEPDSALVAILARRRHGARVHFDVHEDFEGMLRDRAPSFLRPTLTLLARRLMGFIVRRADWITVVSAQIAEQVRGYRPRAGIDVLYNSAPVERYPLSSHRSSGPVLVCHEGWLDEGTGMVPLLQAVRLCRVKTDIRLVLVGRVRPWSEKTFEALVRDLHLSDVIVRRGWVPYELLGPAVAECQVGVVAMQPSTNNFNGLSNKLMSYMASGQACVVPRHSASAALVEQYECGLTVDSTSPEDIAGAFVRLAANAVEREKMGRNGRRAMEEHLGWHIMEGVLAAGYCRLCASKGAGKGVAEGTVRG